MCNSWVFSNDRLQDNTLPQDDQSSVACLAAQHAAHKKAAALESQVAAQDPDPGARESNPGVPESDLGAWESDPGEGSDLELVDKEPEPAGEEHDDEPDQYN